MASDTSKNFWSGFAAGIPIGLGYFAVAFALGIVAKNAGLNPVQGFIASFFNVASAGEKALFDTIAKMDTYLILAGLTVVINARYLLMSCSLSQKFDSKTGFLHRLLIGFAVTDELFGLAISRPGKIKPAFNYGAIIISVFLWSSGTALGVMAGEGLPQNIVSALSVALYGMFIAIIIPPARTDWVIRIAVLISFAASWGFSVTPYLKDISGGTKTIILTIIIASACAIIKPVEDEEVPSESDEAKIKTDSGEVNER